MEIILCKEYDYNEQSRKLTAIKGHIVDSAIAADFNLELENMQKRDEVEHIVRESIEPIIVSTTAKLISQQRIILNDHNYEQKANNKQSIYESITGNSVAELCSSCRILTKKNKSRNIALKAKLDLDNYIKQETIETVLLKTETTIEKSTNIIRCSTSAGEFCIDRPTNDTQNDKQLQAAIANSVAFMDIESSSYSAHKTENSATIAELDLKNCAKQETIKIASKTIETTIDNSAKVAELNIETTEYWKMAGTVIDEIIRNSIRAELFSNQTKAAPNTKHLRATEPRSISFTIINSAQTPELHFSQNQSMDIATISVEQIVNFASKQASNLGCIKRDKRMKRHKKIDFFEAPESIMQKSFSTNRHIIEEFTNGSQPTFPLTSHFVKDETSIVVTSAIDQLNVNSAKLSELKIVEYVILGNQKVTADGTMKVVTAVVKQLINHSATVAELNLQQKDVEQKNKERAQQRNEIVAKTIQQIIHSSAATAEHNIFETMQYTNKQITGKDTRDIVAMEIAHIIDYSSKIAKYQRKFPVDAQLIVAQPSFPRKIIQTDHSANSNIDIPELRSESNPIPAMLVERIISISIRSAVHKESKHVAGGAVRRIIDNSANTAKQNSKTFTTFIKESIDYSAKFVQKHIWHTLQWIIDYSAKLAELKFQKKNAIDRVGSRQTKLLNTVADSVLHAVEFNELGALEVEESITIPLNMYENLRRPFINVVDAPSIDDA